MKNVPQEDEEQDNTPDDLPVINIDADPDNANWLRILAQRREEAARKGRQSPQQPPPAQ